MISQQEVDDKRKWYLEIEERIKSLEQRLIEARTIRDKSLLEEMQNLRFDHSVSDHFSQAVKYLESSIKELQDKLPCWDFWHRFGGQFHELYKEKYPIGLRTRIVDFGDYTHEVRYFVPVYYEVARLTESPPAFINSRIYQVPLQLWADTYGAYAYLGWVDEERVVAVGKFGYDRVYSR